MHKNIHESFVYPGKMLEAQGRPVTGESTDKKWKLYSKGKYAVSKTNRFHVFAGLWIHMRNIELREGGTI